MLLQRIRPGIQIGLIASSATAGVVVAYGWRTRGALRPFAAVGRHLVVGVIPEGGWADALTTALGVLFHVALMVAWGILFASAASRLRGWTLLIASFLCAAAAFAVHSLLPPLLRPGYDVMALEPRLAVHVMLALALAAGMRLANSGAQAKSPFA